MNDITITHCSWIGDNPKMNPACCKPVAEGKSYCEDHVWQVYQKGTALARRKKDTQRANTIWDFESEFNAAVEELVNAGEIEL
jgi:hypothetical protein